MTEPAEVHARTPHAPAREPHARLFLRFLRFGFLAWGGPVAQIDMIRKDLVDDERWISRDRFNRVLAVYQVLPGPEAHELCVYFGMLARGRLGAVLAGLGFMLPGFILMFALSAFYVTYGIAPAFEGLFRGFQAGVGALIVRAVHRIGGNALTDRWLWAIAAIAAIAALFGVHFVVTLAVCGVTYVLARKEHPVIAAVVVAAFLGVVGLVAFVTGQATAATGTGAAELGARTSPSLLTLLLSGLRSGLLTFGGAYTVIPFLQHDAVVAKGWMTNTEFLDGLALSGILPAPLIIFATFVGYIGGGPTGALLMTVGIFAPAFAFTLVGHEYLERTIEQRAVRTFLYGVTAGVVGLIAATTVGLLRAALTGWVSVAIFAVALVLLYIWHAKMSVVVAVLGAGLLGYLVFRP
jgi:chromate transporter